MGDHQQMSKSSRYVTSHPGQLSLAIPPWACTISTSKSAMGLVNTWMGDHQQMSKSSRYATSQPPRSTQPGHPSLGMHNKYQEKRDALAPYL